MSENWTIKKKLRMPVEIPTYNIRGQITIFTKNAHVHALFLSHKNQVPWERVISTNKGTRWALRSGCINWTKAVKTDVSLKFSTPLSRLKGPLLHCLKRLQGRWLASKFSCFRRICLRIHSTNSLPRPTPLLIYRFYALPVQACYGLHLTTINLTNFNIFVANRRIP